jgi:hypothetical protein
MEPAKEYLAFCDESEKHGRYFSNFYGGLIVSSSDYQRVTDKLNQTKLSLNLFGEVKFEKVTGRYLDKYQTLMRVFFSEVAQSSIKIRIMFRQNAQRPIGLTAEDHDLEYFKLYYQFIKHAFGFKYVPPQWHPIRLRLYFDQFPDTKEKAEQFKGYLLGLPESSYFSLRGKRFLSIAKEDIAEVRSHDHVLLQCLDIVLGSMRFRLNDWHLEKAPGERIRGKRTRAKEAVYKTVLAEVKKLYPNFNIGITTGHQSDLANRWHHPYRRWLFEPKDFVYDEKLTKGKRKSE